MSDWCFRAPRIPAGMSMVRRTEARLTLAVVGQKLWCLVLVGGGPNAAERAMNSRLRTAFGQLAQEHRATAERKGRT